MTLVRNLVTGGVNQFLEEHIAEGDGLKGGLDAEQTADTRSRCKIVQISLFDGPLAQYGVSFEREPLLRQQIDVKLLEIVSKF